MDMKMRKVMNKSVDITTRKLDFESQITEVPQVLSSVKKNVSMVSINEDLKNTIKSFTSGSAVKDISESRNTSALGVSKKTNPILKNKKERLDDITEMYVPDGDSVSSKAATPLK